MKTKIKNPIIFSCLIAFILTSSYCHGQDAEKQKIIDVINTELESWYQKDKAKWADTWAHTPDIAMTEVGAFGSFQIQSWDSLMSARENYFKNPARDPNMPKITKSNFNVKIGGPLAVVDLIQKYQDNFVARQTVLLERQGKAWKITRMTTIGDLSPSDQAVEGAINAQGYALLDMKKIDEAIKVFTLNTQLYPSSANTWDSLGEAFLAKGEKEIAYGFYKKSVAMDPRNEHGKQVLEQLASKN